MYLVFDGLTDSLFEVSHEKVRSTEEISFMSEFARSVEDRDV
jgi:hypothetical protein